MKNQRFQIDIWKKLFDTSPLGRFRIVVTRHSSISLLAFLDLLNEVAIFHLLNLLFIYHIFFGTKFNLTSSHSLLFSIIYRLLQADLGLI